MKKKVTSMLMCFALLFALTACKEGKTGDENGGVPCPIEGLEWGMTVDECLAALSLTEDDVEIDRWYRSSHRLGGYLPESDCL